MKQKTVGIFLIDARLLSSPLYLATINKSLLNFNFKFPDAYLSIILFDTSREFIIHFQKMSSLIVIPLTLTDKPVKIFDAIGSTIEEMDWLLEIYEISKVYVWIAALAKDQGSKKYSLFDIINIINEKKALGWHFYFPFSDFETIASVNDKSLLF